MHFKTIDKTASIIPFKLLKGLVSPRLISLVYHTVGYKQELPYLDNLYRIPTPEQFEKDIDFILKHYNPISLQELIHYNTTNELPGKGKYFFLSFDDGLKQCKDFIAPVLERKGVPATFFLNTSFINNRSFLHRFKAVLLSKEIFNNNVDKLLEKVEDFLDQKLASKREAGLAILNLRYPQRKIIDELAKLINFDIDTILKDYAPYMSKADIESLISKGHSVGSHSLDHPEFYLLPEEDQVQQVLNSVNDIDKMFSPKHKVFAFPFTDVGVNTSFFRKIENKCKLDLTFASSGIKNDKENSHIHRISMDDVGLNANNRLKSELLYYGLKAPLGKNNYKRK